MLVIQVSRVLLIEGHLDSLEEEHLLYQMHTHWPADLPLVRQLVQKSLGVLGGSALWNVGLIHETIPCESLIQRVHHRINQVLNLC